MTISSEAATTERTVFTSVRYSVPLPDAFEQAVSRFEAAVPAYPMRNFHALIHRRAAWSEVLELPEANAPWGFMTYWRNDIGAIMALAQDSGSCVAYLMGNQTIAEKMFHFDPRVMNYAPLRTSITQQPGGAVNFTVDRPRTQFSSFNDPRIAQTGLELDHKLAALITHLGGNPPAELQET